MTNEVEVFEEELVPVLEEMDGYRVCRLVEESREMRMLVSRRLDRVMEEEQFSRMWIPFDMASSGVNLDLIFPTHLLVPEDLEADEMDVERGTVRRMRQRIKVKLNKAHRTVELDAEYRRQDN